MTRSLKAGMLKVRSVVVKIEDSGEAYVSDFYGEHSQWQIIPKIKTLRKLRKL